MVIRDPIATRNALCDARVDRFDAGSGAGKIRIYTGTQPTSADDAASGTLLVEITLNDPAFGASASGSATIDADPALTGTASATGTAGWWRGLDSDNNTVMDGSVTASGGGGDLTLVTTSITSGGTVTLTGGTLTAPASA
jgi:hypothetical protein